MHRERRKHHRGRDRAKSRITSLLAVMLGAAGLFAGCTPGVVGVPEELPPFSASSLECARWMAGSFADGGQACRLDQARIWDERTDGIWFYSELEAGASPDRAVQQSILRLNDDLDGGLLIACYRLPGAGASYLGDWRTPSAFNRVDPGMLQPRGGCSIHLESMAGGYGGSTRGEGCASTLPGSAYQTTRLELGPRGIRMWLKGFDGEGTQVFGPARPGWTLERVDARDGAG